MSASERPRLRPGFTDDELNNYDAELCVNCDAVLAVDNQGLYCSTLCREKAKFVRYARGCLRDGRAERDPDVGYALRIRMAVILGGGYPPERPLPRDVRLAVIQRDHGLCRLCGAQGEEIDHIDGSSPDLSNLRLLCRACHRQVTEEHLVPATQEQAADARALWSRVTAVQPGRLCDDEQRWASSWRELLAARKDWLWAWESDVYADEVCIDPSDYDGGFGPGSYFTHAMDKDD